MNAQISALQALDMAPGWDPDGARIEELKGGLTNANRVYRVRSKDNECVLRLGSGDSEIFGPDRNRELEIMQAAQEAGIAPRVLYSNPDAGILMTEFLHGRVWQESDLESDENIEALADILRKVHALQTRSGPIDLVGIAEKYERHLEPRHGLHAFAVNCVRIIRQCFVPENISCCHNDIVATNVIDAGRLKLIDWEYACDNDPLFDLASLIGFHNFDDKRQQTLLSAYAGAASNDLRERLAEQVRVFDAIQWLWLATRQLRLPQAEQARRLEELQMRIR